MANRGGVILLGHFLARVPAKPLPEAANHDGLGSKLCKRQDAPGWIFHPDLACTVESLSLRHDHSGTFRGRDHIIQAFDLDVEKRRALGILLG